ncbi:MAG: TIGR03086 family protein [Chloroflexi bacterium]|nr:TIGR03086 family protein [Chloroflexota bacterium]
MDTVALFSKASRATAEIASNVTESQLSGATPCAEFDVKGLANHIAGFYGMTAMAARKQAPEGEPGADIVGSDPASVIPGMIKGAVAAWQEPGSTEGKTQFGSGESDASFAASITLWETVIHGWDLAKGTGQDLQVSDDVGEAIFGIAQQLCNDGSRGEGKPFAAEISISDGASAFEKALGLSGRDPNWSA